MQILQHRTKILETNILYFYYTKKSEMSIDKMHINECMLFVKDVHLKMCIVCAIIELKEGDLMAIIYTKNVLDELKAKGYSTYRLRHDKIFGEGTIQRIRNKKPIAWEVVEKICELLDCTPDYFLSYEKKENNQPQTM